MTRHLISYVRLVVPTLLCARLSAQVPAEVTGHVTARSDGHPIANAFVEGAQTNEQGSFVLHGLTPGHQTLRIRALGFRATTLTVDVANGQTTTVDVALDAIRLPGITVLGHGDTTGATTITHDDIVRSGRQDLGGVLQDRAGVLVVSAGGPGAPSHLSIRGSSANEILVLVDGVPINSPVTGEADLSTIPLSTIERVTVLKGAQSARWGGRAMAGVVLIETRRPTVPDAELDASAASYGERESALSIGGPGPDDISGILSASRRLSRGDFPYNVPAVRGGGTAIRGDDGFSASAVDGALTRDVGPLALRLHGTYDANARGLPGSVAAPSFTAHGSDDRLAGGLDASSSGNPTSSGNSIQWSADVEGDREHTRFNDSTPPIGAPYDDHTTASSLTELASASWRGLSVGGESRLIDVTATDLAANTPRLEHENGIWARAVEHVAMLNIDAGARADWSSLLSGVFISPKIGLSATHGALTAAVSWGDGFTAPSLGDQFFHEGVLVKPNPTLQPERVHDDVEARLTLRDVALGPVRLGGEVAAYRANVDGMILWFPDFRFVWSPENTNVHRYGWDATTTLSMKDLTVRGTITDVAVDYATPALGGQVAYRPRLTGAIAATLSEWRATLDVTNRYIGDRRTVQGSALNAIGAYWLTDAQLTLRVLSQFDLLAGVDNAFDHHVALLFDYPLPARTWRVGFRLHTLTTAISR
ncbi:MAG TPA: TonB-dependent receptor [Gemmatimonadaceae bacterium]|nr:TonB-dependent receptor [Gemmatimonadaceae bacterium]